VLAAKAYTAATNCQYLADHGIKVTIPLLTLRGHALVAAEDHASR
jgi:rRNA-processing protein FCF1